MDSFRLGHSAVTVSTTRIQDGLIEDRSKQTRMQSDNGGTNARDVTRPLQVTPFGINLDFVTPYPQLTMSFIASPEWSSLSTLGRKKRR
jgi:hypothetical protein